MSEIALFVDDIPCPFAPVQCDFAKAEYTELYHHLFSNLGIDKEHERGVFIDYRDYANGYAIYAFDISGGFGNQTLSLIKSAVLRLESRFKEALSENITAVVYGKFNDVFQIDSARNIIPRTL